MPFAGTPREVRDRDRINLFGKIDHQIPQLIPADGVLSRLWGQPNGLPGDQSITRAWSSRISGRWKLECPSQVFLRRVHSRELLGCGCHNRIAEPVRTVRRDAPKRFCSGSSFTSGARTKSPGMGVASSELSHKQDSHEGGLDTSRFAHKPRDFSIRRRHPEWDKNRLELLALRCEALFLRRRKPRGICGKLLDRSARWTCLSQALLS